MKDEWKYFLIRYIDFRLRELFLAAVIPHLFPCFFQNLQNDFFGNHSYLYGSPFFEFQTRKSISKEGKREREIGPSAKVQRTMKMWIVARWARFAGESRGGRGGGMEEVQIVFWCFAGKGERRLYRWVPHKEHRSGDVRRWTAAMGFSMREKLPKSCILNVVLTRNHNRFIVAEWCFSDTAFETDQMVPKIGIETEQMPREWTEKGQDSAFESRK